MSGPFPLHVQEELVRSVVGLENAEIVKPGYDVEYDFVDPKNLHQTLETKQVKGLYLGGQICGTTGYEEAGAQGIVAGANAGLASKNRAPLVIERDEGYIGVLIDDLITKGASEPYRMFTSRSEYRLSLRADNADSRLTEKGYEYGVVSSERMDMFVSRKQEIEKAMATLHGTTFRPHEWSELGAKFHMKVKDGSSKSAADLLARPGITLTDIEEALKSLDMQNIGGYGTESGVSRRNEGFKVPDFVRDTIEAECKYFKYLRRQEAEMERWRRNKLVPFPIDLEYKREDFGGCSNEEFELLVKHRPSNLHEASKIQGFTAHTLAYLYNRICRTNAPLRNQQGKSAGNGAELKNS